MVQMLVAAGANVNQVAPDGSTALLVATASLATSSAGYERVGTFLLEHGAELTVAALPYTVLHVAVATGKAELVKAVLARGADPNARAGRGGDKDMVKVSKGATPFWLAAKQVDTNLMRLLIAAGADRTVTPDDGTTALMAAAGVGQVEGPRARADFTSPYRSHWDESRALEAVTLLLDLGDDINAANRSKSWSALHGAAHMGADRMVQLLVERGATLDAKDKNGQTPWSLAAEGARDQLTRIPHKSTADLLRKLGAIGASSK
jgi:ankyrin repeat protein